MSGLKSRELALFVEAHLQKWTRDELCDLIQGKWQAKKAVETLAEKRR